MPREAVLVQAFVELADTLVDDFDVVELLTVLSDRCLDVLDIEAAGIMLVGVGGEPRVMASSSEAMHLLELLELQSQQGPCLDCYRTGEPVVNEVLAENLQRWPRFSVEAQRAGFRTVHALPLRLRGTIIGALNLFNTEVGRLERDDTEIAQALADVATIAILQHRAAPRPKPSTSSSWERSTAASPSNRPRAWSPNGSTSTWSRPSVDFAPTHDGTTSV